MTISDGELTTPPSADSPVDKTVNVILEYALKSRATDIHIEPREAIVQVRYRVDGILRETMTLPKTVLDKVVAHIKALCNLKTEEQRSPQDGRFKFSLDKQTIDLRVSILPVIDGEKVVMRLWDESAQPLTLAELGLKGEALSRVTRGLHQPHGLVLVAGPTDSGKSATLYSLLSMLNAPGVNISTIEDPIEYRLDGINQTATNPKTGMTFATGLRSLLRQDPNVIMVGELRNSETADLAVQAALGGQVVLSALHTANAATTLTRLFDMGIKPFLVASSVNTVIAQRLVRRLCTNCRTTYVPKGEALAALRRDFQLDAALKLFSGSKETAAIKLLPVAATVPAPTLNSPAVRGKLKIIQPDHPLSANRNILDKIAADPNILNRSAAEAETARSKPAVSAQPTKAAPKPTPAAAPTNLKEGQFLLYQAGPGCNQCGHDGYLGRIGLYEVLEVNEAVSQIVASRGTAEVIEDAAVRAGMLTLQQDGLLKCLDGQTTIEEVLRVTREIDR